jgi:hypothetical protein
MLFWVDLTLESGVGQAARYGVTGAANAGMSREESIRHALRRVTGDLAIADADIQFSHLVEGEWAGGVGGPGAVQRLAVTYRHKVLVLTPFFDNGQIALRAEATMKNEERFE